MHSRYARAAAAPRLAAQLARQPVAASVYLFGALLSAGVVQMHAIGAIVALALSLITAPGFYTQVLAYE